MSEQQASKVLVGCEECGLVTELPVLTDGQKASCPRCGHTLAKHISQPFQRPLSYGIACLIMLVLSISFPFMSFSVQGISQEITLLHAAKMLSNFKNSLLAALLLLTVVILPAVYITIVLYLYWVAKKLSLTTGTKSVRMFEKRLCRGMTVIEPWLMVDVFLIGVLVSLIKIASLADIGLGMSFWAFCFYTLLVVKCVSMVDRTWLWLQFAPMLPLPGLKVGDSHQSANHVGCHTCAQLNPMPAVSHARCCRCHSILHPYHPQQSLQRSWALLIAAVVFFVPANLYPMMFTVSLGNSEGSTIMEGVVLLWQLGSYPIAAVIFLASIIIPLAKIFALFWLYMKAQAVGSTDGRQAIQRLRLYRITELIGRWSMIDIFVVAILVALVQLQNLMAIFPGPAALSFASVVILTMLSAMTFDPRIFWTEDGPTTSSSNHEQAS
ncbi:paraquat-inducible protein A [Photobacterium alginatilyticum]|uniref:Paraquat-inducible protein A n=1 Tax=Photobacterium alginatilyticum TaxID=1775171 RepID=A0ABW9YRZ9_9GAMM|nr:paraquat-inducible protein A [Photobacterium alginatilyticum]NBI55998.1 paraquat-inducible protein A [Photobacterium alginatilyticum]